MSEIFSQVAAIIIGGAALGLLTFIAAMSWNLRKVWILDHEWQKAATKTLEEYRVKFEKNNQDYEQMLLKITGLDHRLTTVEHPSYYTIKRRKLEH